MSGIRDKDWKLHLGLIAGGLIIDQLTKAWVLRVYALANGEIQYGKITRVLGEWIQFRLAYNEGAAFSLQPHKILPWMHPTLFFGLISCLALAGLWFFYRSLPRQDKASQIGISLIASGAFGNLTDRLRLHKVVDFIDVGIPGFDPRWPTFNVADSMVCIGVGTILLWPLLFKKKITSPDSRKNPAPPV